MKPGHSQVMLTVNWKKTNNQKKKNLINLFPHFTKTSAIDYRGRVGFCLFVRPFSLPTLLSRVYACVWRA